MLDNNKFKLSNIIEELAKLGVCNLLVEGGGEVFTSFLNEDLVDRLIIFRSNYFIGGTGVNAINLLNKKKKITFKPTQLSIVKNNTMEILEKQNYWNMFTGIIKKVGVIYSWDAKSRVIGIKSEFDSLILGESISCSGVCLTVSNFE